MVRAKTGVVQDIGAYHCSVIRLPCAVLLPRRFGDEIVVGIRPLAKGDR